MVVATARKCCYCEKPILSNERYYTCSRNGDTPLCYICARGRGKYQGYPLIPSDACPDCGRDH